MPGGPERDDAGRDRRPLGRGPGGKIGQEEGDPLAQGPGFLSPDGQGDEEAEEEDREKRAPGSSTAHRLLFGFMFLTASHPPGRPHRLVDQAVGFLVPDEALRGGIEPERPAEADGDLGQVDERAGAVARSPR